MSRPFIAVLLIAGATVVEAAGTNTLFRESFETIGGRWRQVKFDGLTDYRLATEGSNVCLMGRAKGTASAFTAKFDLPPAPMMTLLWRWKIDRCPTNGTDDVKRTFDHSARVFVAFDTRLGPPRTINYVWANRFPTNAVFEHPVSSRSKLIAVRSGNTQAGTWLSERRDLAKDWARLFPGEKMPKIVGLGVFTDSDGTGELVTGWYDDIVLTAP